MAREDGAPARARQARTQAQRSEDTVQALYKATMELMLEEGLHRLTTPRIAEAAGVSRGALTHHFASRHELISRAIGNHLRQVNERLHGFARALAEREGSADQIVDYLWETMADGLFYVTLEYLPEARHNKALHAHLVPVVQEFHGGLDAIWAVLAEKEGIEAKRAKMLLNMTMCLFRGMIAQTILRDDPDYYAEMLKEWKAQLPFLMHHRPGEAP
ncbi:TetR/AcrR family transcriptional regulator [Poseidonocella sp. HB161398]|uniref:TetR/AcrR family transcriptional regulator n=1 Tax=Poseidonocella sp. HB161398 TaxID=2320855 RepID=UPI001108CBB9|nr:TetR/AcrR family transcriptional regulator [Poseidonocella sp. HB161398]